MKARTAATYALNAVLSGKQDLNQSLADHLPKVKAADRALTQELSFGAARWQPELSQIMQHLVNKPLKHKDQDLQALLLIGLYQLKYMQIAPHAAISETVNVAQDLGKTWAKGLINASLRNFLRRRESICAKCSVNFAHPTWLLEELQKSYPKNWQDICDANNQRPPLTLRINSTKTNREQYLADLQQEQIAAIPSAISSVGITLAKAQMVENIYGFTQGLVSVQDDAAQLAAYLLDLAPNLKVLDACAAPGGKTCHILELEPQVKLTAVELNAKRALKISQNLQRLNLNCELKTADVANLDSWWDGVKFERILLDAPCSGTGIIRRHPDIKIRRKPADIADLVKIQAHLLQQMWQILAPNGILLYATCSILPQENSKQIAQFLARHKDAKELTINYDFGTQTSHGLQLLPQNNDGFKHDGFYYAKLQKSTAN